MAAYAVKTEVTASLNTKQATLTAGTSPTGSQAILSGSTIKNIIPGTGMSLSSDANGIVITCRDAYTKTETDDKLILKSSHDSGHRCIGHQTNHTYRRYCINWFTSNFIRVYREKHCPWDWINLII